MLVAALTLQIAAGPPDEAEPRPRTTAPRPCLPGEPDEVVVCARDPETFRLRPLAVPRGADDPALPKAETQIAPGVEITAEAEQGNIGNTPTNRAMVRLELKF